MVRELPLLVGLRVGPEVRALAVEVELVLRIEDAVAVVVHDIDLQRRGQREPGGVDHRVVGAELCAVVAVEVYPLHLDPLQGGQGAGRQAVDTSLAHLQAPPVAGGQHRVSLCLCIAQADGQEPEGQYDMMYLWLHLP